MRSRKWSSVALFALCLLLIVSAVDAQTNRNSKKKADEASTKEVTNRSKTERPNRRNPEESNPGRKKDDPPVRANPDEKVGPAKPGGKGDDPSKPDDTPKNGTANSTGPKTEGGDEGWIASWAILISKILASLLAVGLMAYAVLRLAGKVRDTAEAYFTDVRTRQNDLSNKLETTISALDKSVALRLNGIEKEIKEISRAMEIDRREFVRELRQTSVTTAPAYPVYGDEPAAIKEQGIPFPLAVSNLLGKVIGNKEVVTTDFQNNILVNDPDGQGELVLIRDNTVPDGLTFAVPADPNFRTKQDFHTYYERYYDCNRPSSGEVWIVEPAVVDRVAGGWKLREKGVLEVK